MKISPDGSSFSTSDDVDSMSERSSQSNGVQRAPSKEPSFQEQLLLKTEDIIANKLSDDRAGREAELARCVVELAQANERLTAQLYNLSLQFVAHHGTADASSNETIVSLDNKEAKNLQDSLQMMTSEERDELKRSTITLEQEKSDTGLSNLKEDCAQPKSEFSVVKKDCESSIVGFKEEVAPRTTHWSLVQPLSQYVWERSRDACVSCIRQLKLLECPPFTWGVHKKWIIFVAGLFSLYLLLGVVLAVSSSAHGPMVRPVKGGWVYHMIGRQVASGDREGLKHSGIALEQEKSEVVVSSSAHGPMVQPVKHQYVWESSRNVSVDGPRDVELLKCPPMTSGIHKWSILVEKGEGGYFGIASTAYRFENEKYLGYQEGGWAYYRSGRAYHNGSVVSWFIPSLQIGSKVTFILDLTGEGTLSASVDGKSFLRLFSDMLSKVRSVNPEGGFVPAVSLNYCNDEARFLGFESVAA